MCSVRGSRIRQNLRRNSGEFRYSLAERALNRGKALRLTIRGTNCSAYQVRPAPSANPYSSALPSAAEANEFI